MESFDESITRFESHKINFSWRIENFSLCDKQNEEFFESQTFPKSGEDENQWHLELYPNGYCEESKDFISVYVGFNPKENENRMLTYDFNFKNINGKVIRNCSYLPKRFTAGSSCWGDKKFVRRDQVIDKLVDDVLVVTCLVKWVVDVVNISNEASILAKPNVQGNLANDLQLLIDNGKFSDIKVLANDGTEFPAHKCILAVRSPVFTAMFDHNMKESNEAVVKIDDINADVLKTMLEFVYSGKFVNDKCDIEELLVAADKYAIEDLKVLCENDLIKKLKVENVISYLVVADRHNAKSLKMQTLKLISANIKDLLETEAIQNLSSNLFNDILKNVTSS